MRRQIQTRLRFIGAAVLGVVVLAGGCVLAPTVGQASSGGTQEITGPAPPGRQMATFSAGCFWSMQAIFQELKGVDKVDPGYTGGTTKHPSYQLVESGSTGYAESINITFDPSVISYAELLKILLTARDPTTLNSQGPDFGTQYRSVIWYRDSAQEQEATDAIRAINASHFWRSPIVTAVEPFTMFYRAEDYHLNYYNRHPNEPYCTDVIAPEIARFRTMYKSDLK